MLFGKVHNLLQHHFFRSLIIINLSAISRVFIVTANEDLEWKTAGFSLRFSSARFLIRMNNYLQSITSIQRCCLSSIFHPPSKLFFLFYISHLAASNSLPALFPFELSKISFSSSSSSSSFLLLYNSTTKM